jgi:hypothetical protein
MRNKRKWNRKPDTKHFLFVTFFLNFETESLGVSVIPNEKQTEAKRCTSIVYQTVLFLLVVSKQARNTQTGKTLIFVFIKQTLKNKRNRLRFGYSGSKRFFLFDSGTPYMYCKHPSKYCINTLASVIFSGSILGYIQYVPLV